MKLSSYRTVEHQLNSTKLVIQMIKIHQSYTLIIPLLNNWLYSTAMIVINVFL